MDTEAVRVRIEAVTTGLNQSFGQAKQFLSGVTQGMRDELKTLSDQAKIDTKNYEGTVEQFGNVVQNRFKGVNSAIKGVQTAWAQLAVVAAAGIFAQKMVTETVQMTVESQKLSRALNITATQASVLSLAIGDVYGSTDQYIAMVQGLNRQLRTNEEAIKSMGIATREANGEYRDQQDIVMDALSSLRNYKEGTDRNLAAQQMFGKGVDVTNEMLALNAEGLEAAKEKADELGLSLSQDNVEAVNKYRAAMNDAGDVIDGMVKALGDALIPVFTELMTLFADYGPQCVLIVRGAIGGLVSVFHGLSLMVKIVWSIMKAFFQSIADYAGAFGKMWTAIFSGDFDAALAARDELWGKLKNNASEAFSQISADASETRDKIFNLFTAGSPVVKTEGGGGKDFKGYEKPGKDTSAADARKAAAELERIRKEEFQAFKEQKDMELELTEKTYAERLRIAREVQAKAKSLFGEESTEYRKASMDILQIEREKAAELRRIKEVQKQAALDASLAEVAAKEQEAAYLHQLGQISNQELLNLQASFEEERYQLELAYLQERLALMDTESEGYAQMLAEIERLKSEHDMRMREYANQASIEQQEPMNQMFESMKQGMAEAIAGWMTGQMSAKQALAAIWKQMLASFTQFLVQKLAASKLFAALEIGVNKMIAAVLRVLGIQSAATAVSSKSGETMGKIDQSAASAGAGAAESQASIPYIGPILAIAAMAAIFAAVMGMKSKAGGSTPSAANGFDIPRGVNPLTQLHEEEMVLPKEQAEAIRNLKDGQQANMNVNINAVDGEGVRRLFANHPKAMAEGIKTLQRRGVQS